MSLVTGGLQSGGGGPASSLGPGATGTTLVLSGASTALQFISTQVTGADAFKVTTNGARFHFGAGASDYASSDGTTVTFASPLSAVGNIISTSGNISAPGGGISSGGSIVAGTLISATTGYFLNGFSMISATAPTLSAGFGASPSVVAATGSVAFSINVGTGGTASTGTIAFPASNNTGWIVIVQNTTTPGVMVTRQTGGSATTAVITNYAQATGLATPWTASDILLCVAIAY